MSPASRLLRVPTVVHTFGVRHEALLATVILAWLGAWMGLPGLLLSGGAAIVFTVGLVALGLGIPLATARHGRVPSSPTRRAWQHTLATALCGVVIAASFDSFGWRLRGLDGWVLGTVVLLAGVADARGPARGPSGLVVWGALLVPVALARAGGLVVSEATPTSPWTALLPTWGTAAAWLPGAVVTGLLAAAAGTELWGRSDDTGARRGHAWGGPAWGVLVVALTAVTLAAAHEASTRPRALAELLTGPATLVLVALPALLVTRALAPAAARRASVPEALAWGAFVSWVGPDLGAWLWRVVLPLGLAAGLLDDARASAGSARVRAAVGATLALGAAVAARPALPEHASTAALIGLCGAVLVWVGGLRSLAARAAT